MIGPLNYKFLKGQERSAQILLLIHLANQNNKIIYSHYHKKIYHLNSITIQKDFNTDIFNVWNIFCRGDLFLFYFPFKFLFYIGVLMFFILINLLSIDLRVSIQVEIKILSFHQIPLNQSHFRLAFVELTWHPSRSLSHQTSRRRMSEGAPCSQKGLNYTDWSLIYFDHHKEALS